MKNNNEVSPFMMSPPFIYKICQIFSLVIKRGTLGKNIINEIKKGRRKICIMKKAENAKKAKEMKSVTVVKKFSGICFWKPEELMPIFC